MRFVVTGSNGLVGSRLCLLLRARGHETVGLSLGPRLVGGDYSYVDCDLTRRDELDAALSDARPDIIVHTAAMTDVDGCERDPDAAYAVNVEGTATLARATRRLGAHLVHVSTDYVFDGEHGPYGEDDTPSPRGVYALTKHMGEEAVRALASSWTIARPAVVYGWPPSDRPNFGSWLVNRLEQGQPVRLFEDQHVSPTLADNCAAMLAELGERRMLGIWHTCGADIVDRVEFGRAVCELLGFDPALLVPVKMKDVDLAIPRPKHSGLRAEKARRELEAKPLALREALDHFRRDYLAGRGG